MAKIKQYGALFTDISLAGITVTTYSGGKSVDFLADCNHGVVSDDLAQLEF